MPSQQVNKTAAIVPGNRLGDGLLLSVIAFNLLKNGYNVTTFSSVLGSLKNWLPDLNIKDLPKPEFGSEAFKNFGLIIHQHPNLLSRHQKYPHQTVHVLYGKKLFMQRKSLIEVYLDVCSITLKLPNIFRQNGVVIPPHLTYRSNKKRVVVHPTSLRPEKNWSKNKFIKLAQQLKTIGFDPHFTVGPTEYEQWRWLEKLFPLEIFPTLEELASYMYESGYMIGNDSGVAHLASTIGIPTVTLFIRPGVAKRWKPNFHPGAVILPTIHLPGKRLKEKFWKHLISKRKVFSYFKKTVKRIDPALLHR